MWMKTDNELREVYNQWTKHVKGTIEVTFCVPGAERSDHSLEGYQSDLLGLLRTLQWLLYVRGET